MNEHIIHISKKTFDDRYFHLLEQPIETDVIHQELEDRFIIKFALPNFPFIFYCIILKSDLLKEITKAGYDLTKELVDNKFTEFRNKYLRFTIEEEIDECQTIVELNGPLER